MSNEPPSKLAAQMTPLDDFDKIGSGIYLYRPANSTSNSESSDPCLILLCTFMGASKKIVAKYAAGHQKLFPASTTLIVMSGVKETFAFNPKEPARTKLVTETVVSIKSSSSPSRPIVLHAQSNGGTAAASRIVRHLKSLNQPSSLITHTIIDCAPSYPRLYDAITAICMSLPYKPGTIRYFLAFWTLYTLAGIAFFTWNIILRNEDIILQLRRRLNDAQFFDPKAPRLYLFTKMDKLIPYRDIIDHVEDAKAKGWKVKAELFETAPHCGLILEDAERYWGAIRRLLTGRQEG